MICPNCGDEDFNDSCEECGFTLENLKGTEIEITLMDETACKGFVVGIDRGKGIMINFLEWVPGKEGPVDWDNSEHMVCLNRELFLTRCSLDQYNKMFDKIVESIVKGRNDVAESIRASQAITDGVMDKPHGCGTMMPCPFE